MSSAFRRVGGGRRLVLIDQDLLVDDGHDEVVELVRPHGCLRRSPAELVRTFELLVLVVAGAAVLLENADSGGHVRDEAHGLEMGQAGLRVAIAEHAAVGAAEEELVRVEEPLDLLALRLRPALGRSGVFGENVSSALHACEQRVERVAEWRRVRRGPCRRLRRRAQG